VRKIAVKRLIRDEKGQTLILVLILLAVGALIIAPLLNYMGTGLLAGRVYEKKAVELYAADAGAEDAVWKIQHNVDIPSGCSNDLTRNYTITDVNGKSVTFTITRANNVTLTYHVISTATGDGSGTKIDAYVTGTYQYGNFAGLLNQIVTSQNGYDIANKVTLNYSAGCGPVANYTGDWPTPADLEGFYWQDVKNATPYTSSTLDAKNYAQIGPLFRDGPLNIVNTGASGLTLALNGTVYITGDTDITPNTEMTLDLNGKTIFVSSNTTGNQKALIIGGKCNIKGPGVIVAVGDINFQPKSQIGQDQGPIFILSVLGTTTVQPSGNIYGAIAGSIDVYVQQGEQPTITYPQGGFGSSDLNFPTGIQYLFYRIASWEVKPL
jgi:hypothetical protein